MQVVGVFGGFATIAGEKECPVFFVDAFDVFRVPGALRDAAFLATGGVVQIEMSPSVALAPVNDLASAIDQSGATNLHVCIQSFFDQHFNRSGFNIQGADIDPLQIAAGPVEIQFV